MRRLIVVRKIAHQRRLDKLWKQMDAIIFDIVIAVPIPIDTLAFL
jgi:hypothetical protein